MDQRAGKGSPLEERQAAGIAAKEPLSDEQFRDRVTDWILSIPYPTCGECGSGSVKVEIDGEKQTINKFCYSCHTNETWTP